MTLSDESLKALIELAEKAKSGPWFFGRRRDGLTLNCADGQIAVFFGDHSDTSGFIATADPTTVKAIVEELLAARETLQWLKNDTEMREALAVSIGQLDDIRAKNSGEK